MPRVVHVRKAQQRYKQVPVIDPATGVQAVTVVQRKKPTKRGATTHTMKRTQDDRTQPLPPETCEACSKPIEPGTPYKWVQVRRTYGNIRRTRHESCPAWQPWDLSDSLGARIMRIVHDAETAMEQAESADDITSALADAAQEVRDLADEKRESAQSIEDGFGHETYVSQELAEMADSLESWADELEQHDVDDAPDEDDHTLDEQANGTVDCACGESFATDDDADQHVTDAESEHEDAMNDWRESAVSEASDLLGNSPA